MFERNVDLSNRFQQSLLFCDWKENNNNNDNQKTKGTATQRTKSRVDEWTSSAPEIKLPPPRLTPTFLGTSANHINVCQTLLSSFPLESFYSAWPHQSLSPVPPPPPPHPPNVPINYHHPPTPPALRRAEVRAISPGCRQDRGEGGG